MTLTKRLIQFLLVMVTAITVGFAASLYAQATQQDQAQSQQQGQQQDQQSQSDTEPAGDDNTEQTPEQALPDIDSQPIQPGARSTGRFIPSEQISQDLGVSFPVDI